MFSAIRSQRTTVLVSCYSSAKGLRAASLFTALLGLPPVSGFRLQKTDVLVSAFTCKGLHSLFSAIRLQRTTVLVFCYLSAKDCVLFTAFWDCVLFAVSICKGLMSLFPAICLQRTDELVSRFCSKGLLCLFSLLFAKDCCPCFLTLVSKECRPCFCHLFTKDCCHYFPI